MSVYTEFDAESLSVYSINLKDVAKTTTFKCRFNAIGKLGLDVLNKWKQQVRN